VRCDAGIVEIKNHPFVITVMTTFLPREDDGEAVIKKIALMTYDYFERLGRSSSYGRVISEK
jgi:hypothetical protein